VFYSGDTWLCGQLDRATDSYIILGDVTSCDAVTKAGGWRLLESSRRRSVASDLSVSLCRGVATVHARFVLWQQMGAGRDVGALCLAVNRCLTN